MAIAATWPNLALAGRAGEFEPANYNFIIVREGKLMSTTLERNCSGEANERVLHRRELVSPTLSVLRLSYDGPRFGRTPILPRDDAYFMSVKLKHMSSARLWFGDRVAAELKTPLHVHAVCIAHLSDDPHAEMVDPFDIIRFSVPQSTLNQFIDDMGAKPIEGLQFPVPGTVDPIFGHLASCLLPALENPAHSSPLFVETITRAVSAHVLNKYGNVRFAESRAIRGGLAHWQERRVREMIDTHLDGSVTIAMLAAECGMSSGHFSHAFKRQVGQSPYQYLISQRLLRAKTLMLTTQLPLVEIAVACGFSTQTHFNKRFLAANGISPGVWRRLNATRKNVGNRD